MTPPLYPGLDTSVPGAALLPGTRVLAGYIGEPREPGPPDTPHIWTAAEWNEYIREDPTGLRCLPLYVHSYPGNAVQDARNACDAAERLGWRRGIGRLIVLDLETMIDPEYVASWGDETERQGFRGMTYGSLAPLSANPMLAGGRFAAELLLHQPPVIPAGLEGIQWRWNDRGWDRDLFSQFVYDNCGQGLRHE